MVVIRTVLAVLMIGAVALAGLAPAQNGGEGAVMLEAARLTELVDGDLNAAIEMYSQIVKRFSQEREVAATALLHLGQSYEKLGNLGRAREAYERILADYGQSRMAAEARASRARLTESRPEPDPPSETVVYQTWTRPAPTIPIQPGGNLQIFSDLTVQNSRTGETRRLSTNNQSAAYPLVSPDGRRVAYLGWTQGPATTSDPRPSWSPPPVIAQLHVVNVDGSNDRVLTDSKDVQWLRPFAWHPNGTEILTVLERGNSTNQIALVSVADGFTRILKSLEWRYPESLAFDGHYVAYTLPARPGAGQRDVFLLAAGGPRETFALEHRYTVAPPPQLPDPPSTDQEAIHVLNRLGFGPRPGDIERVKAMGVDAYIAEQLYPERLLDRVADEKLSALTTLKMTSEQITELIDTHVAVPQVEVRARVFERRRMMDAANSSNTSTMSMETFRRAASQLEPGTEVRMARIVRAVYSERQLQEQMVDFWMNHFNINFSNDLADIAEAAGAGDFEQNVIRPRTLGMFEDLLVAVAKHPAMLKYLDNRLNTAPAETIQKRIEALKPSMDLVEYLNLRERKPSLDKAQGLNENYARELLELHTIGIDGGYSQEDIREVAKVFTGWTTTAWNRGDGITDIGAVGGRFVFDALLHVEGDKVVMGQRIPSGGINEGEQLLRRLARHPSTARFISTKLVRRFVADNPPAAVVDAAARTFERTGGDIREVLRTIFTSSAFRSASSHGTKVKKPFELIVSSLRAANAQIKEPLPRTRDGGVGASVMPLIVNRGRRRMATTERMGETLYTYEAPDGNPDVAAAWINSNSLLARLEFANDLAMNRVPGVSVDLAAAQAVLQQMGMPRPTVEQIEQTRLMMQAAANPPTPSTGATQGPPMMAAGGAANAGERANPVTAEAVIVAAMLGSPQFQTR
jgi:uncharacterized protein (DUF1800 family)